MNTDTQPGPDDIDGNVEPKVETGSDSEFVLEAEPDLEADADGEFEDDFDDEPVDESLGHPEDEDEQALVAAEFASMTIAARRRRDGDREEGRAPREEDFPRPAVDGEEGASAFAPPTSRLAQQQLEAIAPKLQKMLADAGIGSRREMEELILAGRVSVNGEPAHVGQRVEPTDQIRVNGKPLQRRAAKLPRVLMYHKPAGEIVTQDDPEKRATVFDRLPTIKGARWVAVGRLDFNTEGLLLFTTSGDLANRLMHPKFAQERQYAVRCIPALDQEAKQKLIDGVELEDGPAQFARIDDAGGDGANHWYHVVISEGRNREVRRMFEAVGVTVSRLIRVRYGNVDLPRSLKRGRFQEITSMEAACLCAELGMKLVEAPAARGDRNSRNGKTKVLEISPLRTTVEAMFGVSPVRPADNRGALTARKPTMRSRGPDGDVDGNVMSNNGYADAPPRNGGGGGGGGRGGQGQGRGAGRGGAQGAPGAGAGGRRQRKGPGGLHAGNGQPRGNGGNGQRSGGNRNGNVALAQSGNGANPGNGNGGGGNGQRRGKSGNGTPGNAGNGPNAGNGRGRRNHGNAEAVAGAPGGNGGGNPGRQGRRGNGPRPNRNPGAEGAPAAVAGAAVGAGDQAGAAANPGQNPRRQGQNPNGSRRRHGKPRPPKV
ncbi:hypothetical protein BH09PSE6_BH09PSE6_32140 [soil metagenome]